MAKSRGRGCDPQSGIPEQMLKQVLISAGIKRWTHAVDRNNCCATKAALVRTGPVNEVLDGYA
jgi:hypothetical protein